MNENEKKLKDMILSIVQGRKDVKAEQDVVKEMREKLKEIEDEFISLALIEFTK